MSTPSLANRLEEGSMPEPATGCFLWLAGANARGYGQLSVRGRTTRAHVLAYELAKGPVPEGLELDHLCRTPQCVNPEHLEPVTHAENNRRRSTRRVACSRGHALVGDNVKYDSRGAKVCRECTASSALAYYYRATEGGPRRRPKSERGRAVLRRAKEQGR